MSIGTTFQGIFNQAVNEHGTTVLVFTASGTFDDEYGEDMDRSFTGSSFVSAIVSPLTEDEKQFLAEGERVDELMNFYLATTTSIAIDDKINISGTSVNYSVIQLLDDPYLNDVTLYKKVRAFKLR